MSKNQATLVRLDGDAAQQWIAAHLGYHWMLWAFEPEAQVLGVRLTSADPSHVHDALLIFRRPTRIRNDGRITPSSVAFAHRDSAVPGLAATASLVCTATQDELVLQIEAEQVTLYHWVRAEVNYGAIG